MPLVTMSSGPSASEKETADEAKEGAHILEEAKQLEKLEVCYLLPESRPIPILVVAISYLCSGV
jgi:hypothetical protein